MHGRRLSPRSRSRSEVTRGGLASESSDAYVLQLSKAGEGVFELAVSTARAAREGEAQSSGIVRGRRIVVATGFEDVWPDIEIDDTAVRTYERYRSVFRFAGNARGWHVCIRCDGHLHIDEHLAIVGVGDYIFDVVQGAQDFTQRVTILTNGRPHAMSDEILAEVDRRNIAIDQTRIEAHIGPGTDLLGFRMSDGRELYFDGFFVDEGLRANDDFLADFEIQHDEEGLIVCDKSHRILNSRDDPIKGIWACGDIVAGERNLIASAFASGQDAGLEASDSLRRLPYPS